MTTQLTKLQFMSTFEEIFEELAKTDDASLIWTNWLDWVIDSNLITNHNRNLKNFNLEK